MELLTDEIRKQIPPLYAQDEAPDPIAHIKFFTTGSNWTWYATEFDGQDTFFGLVKGFEEELGYFSLQELTEGSASVGLSIERDLNFQPTPLSQLRGKD
jgi:hypothetical protein